MHLSAFSDTSIKSASRFDGCRGGHNALKSMPMASIGCIVFCSFFDIFQYFIGNEQLSVPCF